MAQGIQLTLQNLGTQMPSPETTWPGAGYGQCHAETPTGFYFGVFYLQKAPTACWFSSTVYTGAQRIGGMPPLIPRPPAPSFSKGQLNLGSFLTPVNITLSNLKSLKVSLLKKPHVTIWNRTSSSLSSQGRELHSQKTLLKWQFLKSRKPHTATTVKSGCN